MGEVRGDGEHGDEVVQWKRALRDTMVGVGEVVVLRGVRDVVGLRVVVLRDVVRDVVVMCVVVMCVVCVELRDVVGLRDVRDDVVLPADVLYVVVSLDIILFVLCFQLQIRSIFSVVFLRFFLFLDFHLHSTTWNFLPSPASIKLHSEHSSNCYP